MRNRIGCVGRAWARESVRGGMTEACGEGRLWATRHQSSCAYAAVAAPENTGASVASSEAYMPGEEEGSLERSRGWSRRHDSENVKRQPGRPYDYETIQWLGLFGESS